MCNEIQTKKNPKTGRIITMNIKIFLTLEGEEAGLVSFASRLLC